MKFNENKISPYRYSEDVEFANSRGTRTCVVCGGNPCFGVEFALKVDGTLPMYVHVKCMSMLAASLVDEFTNFSRLPMSACASRHAPCVPCWIDIFNKLPEEQICLRGANLKP
jgi:hypothetical protein